MGDSLHKVDMETYLKAPERYELRPGSTEGAPLCDYGNHYEWVGFDKVENIFVRFTKSVFKKIINE